MKTKSHAAVISAERSAGKRNLFGLDMPAHLGVNDELYTVGDTTIISLGMCLSEDTPKFVASNETINSFAKEALKRTGSMPALDALLDMFGVDALFNTPDTFFCLECHPDSIFCVDNDSGIGGRTLIIHELQTLLSDPTQWFVAPVSCYVHCTGAAIKLRYKWHPEGVQAEEFAATTGVDLVTNINATVQRVLAFLALLNTSGAGERQYVTPDQKLIKANQKRGKSTFTPYTVIRFSGNSGSARAATEGHGVERAAHLVRGHFKRRKSGVFWWKPHVAGTGEFKKRSAYIVKP